mmetsp:Transcript_14432/g.23499  ORF Transcript_14432/g.23499 Transcript_14432/m.23499 type:complete len:108 (+) Transcript_14432:357-680(+)
MMCIDDSNYSVPVGFPVALAVALAVNWSLHHKAIHNQEFTQANQPTVDLEHHKVIHVFKTGLGITNVYTIKFEFTQANQRQPYTFNIMPTRTQNKVIHVFKTLAPTP